MVAGEVSDLNPLHGARRCVVGPFIHHAEGNTRHFSAGSTQNLSSHFNLVGEDRQPGRLHDGMLGQIFYVIRQCSTSQYDSLFAGFEPQIADAPNQTALHAGFQQCDSVDKSPAHTPHPLLRAARWRDVGGHVRLPRGESASVIGVSSASNAHSFLSMQSVGLKPPRISGIKPSSPSNVGAPRAKRIRLRSSDKCIGLVSLMRPKSVR